MNLVDRCLCQKKSFFKPIIIYKNGDLFKDYQGVIIGRCLICGILKTFPNKKFNPQTTHFDYYERNKEFFLNLFQPIVKKLQQFKKSGLVLDVGCSSGIMLEILAQKNFDVYGIEINKKAYQIAAKKFPKKIFYGFLADFLKKTKQQFDVVIYNHVFEHINNLNHEIKLIKKILKTGGILVVGVPNYRNFIFFLRQRFWESLQPNEHIWHFCDRYLINYLEKNNFKILDRYYDNDSRKSYPFIKRVYFQFLIFLNKIFKTGESVVIYAKKI